MTDCSLFKSIPQKFISKWNGLTAITVEWILLLLSVTLILEILFSLVKCQIELGHSFIVQRCFTTLSPSQVTFLSPSCMDAHLFCDHKTTKTPKENSFIETLVLGKLINSKAKRMHRNAVKNIQKKMLFHSCVGGVRSKLPGDDRGSQTEGWVTLFVFVRFGENPDKISITVVFCQEQNKQSDLQFIMLIERYPAALQNSAERQFTAFLQLRTIYVLQNVRPTDGQMVALSFMGLIKSMNWSEFKLNRSISDP